MSALVRIVIPAHNEESRITPTLEDYCAYFGSRATIAVVANGCTDGTIGVVTALALRFSNLRLIDIPGRVGKGGAIRAGLKTGDEPYVGFVDADHSTSAKEFDRLLDICRERDASGVIGSRWIAGARVSPCQPWRRRFASRAFNAMVRLALGLRFYDTQCGAKVFRRADVRSVLDHLALSNFAFDIDLLHALSRAKCQVIEEPTVWADRAQGSTVRLFSAAISMFSALLWLALRDSPLAGIPFFEFIARDVRMSVRGNLRILVCTKYPPATTSWTVVLKDLVQRWTELGHHVDWVSASALPRGGWRSEIAVKIGAVRMLAWYLFTDRRYDAIVEFAEESPSLISRIASKTRVVLSSTSVGLTRRYRRFHRIVVSGDERSSQVVTPGGKRFEHEGNVADIVLSIARTAEGVPGSFSAGDDGLWKISFRDLQSGRPAERELYS
jgi:glycosyltransferase involved in cell wall biosynthesis